MTKRVLSLLLALIMALSLCVPAFAADEPEVSADEPATIAAIDISVLQDAVAQAEAMKPWTNWQKNGGGDATTEIAALKTAYEKAKGILDDIKDSGGIDVWQLTHEASEVNNAATGLINAIGALTDEITDAQKAEMLSEKAALEAVIKAGEEWYNPDYLAKAQDVLDQLTAALASGKFADYAAVELVVDAVYPGDYENFMTTGGAAWQAGCKATKADYEKLYAAVEAAAELLASGIYTPNLTYVNLENAVNQYRGYFVVSQPNNLANWVKVHDVVVMLANLKTLSDALIKDGYTIKVTNTFVAGTFGYVSVSWSVQNDNYDTHTYIVKASYNDGELKTVGVDNGIPSTRPVWTNQTGSFWVNASLFGLTKFPVGGKLTVNFYDKASGELVLSKDITIGAYNGPSITSVTYSPDTITVNFDKSLGTANAHPGTEGAYESLYLVVKDPDGKIIATGDPTAKNPVAGLAIVSGETGTWATSVTLALTKKTAAVGDYVVELWVEESDASGLTTVVARGSKSVEVPDITTYASYTKLTEAIAKAEKMTNYVATHAARTENGFSTQDVRDVLNNNLQACAKFTAVAATTPDTTWNEAAVNKLLSDLNYAMSLMIEGADSAAFEAALAEAKALIPTDYTNWDGINETVGGEPLEGMDDIIAFYEDWADTYLPLPDDADCRALLSAMTATLKAIMAKLEVFVPYADLATLKAMIDSVPARLAADDYSAESKEAVEAAAAAGKALLDKKGVKQSEVQAAIAALEEALNNLTTVKSDAIPAGPDNGGTTGWATAENGDYYYYKDGKLVQGDWVSSKGLWYHMGATGKMDTGFIHIVDKWGDGWYYLNPSNTKGTMGRMFTGWKMINDASAGAWGWFETRSNGHQGQCTYTTNWGDFKNYKPVEK